MKKKNFAILIPARKGSKTIKNNATNKINLLNNLTNKNKTAKNIISKKKEVLSPVKKIIKQIKDIKNMTKKFIFLFIILLKVKINIKMGIILNKKLPSINSLPKKLEILSVITL